MVGYGKKLLIVNTLVIFLKNKGIKLYHTYSETKELIAERKKRTLKEKCEKVKTQYAFEGMEYQLYYVLPQVLKI